MPDQRSEGISPYRRVQYQHPKDRIQSRLQQSLGDYEYIFSHSEKSTAEKMKAFSYCKKTGKAIEDAAWTTAERYFEWTLALLLMHKNKLVYFGTAPFKDKLNSEEASEASTQRLQVITAFNAALAKNAMIIASFLQTYSS